MYMGQNLIDSPRRSFLAMFQNVINLFIFRTPNYICFDRMSVRLFTRRIILIDIRFGMFDEKQKLVVKIFY